MTTVSACLFKRKQNSEWERGVMIGDAIIDKTFKIIDVYAYKITHDQGCFLTHLG